MIVVYSNTSPSNAIRLLIPIEAYEKRMLVPQPSFDGNPGRYADPEFEKRERIPRHGEWIEPAQELRVKYWVGDRFLVPKDWEHMSVTPVHSLQLSIREYTFNRRGQLVAVNQVANHSLEELREQICRVPRIRKALLEDTLRVPPPAAGGDSGGTATVATAAGVSTGQAVKAVQPVPCVVGSQTQESVKDRGKPPVQAAIEHPPWEILAGGAVVAAAAVYLFARSVRNRKARAGVTDN